MSDIDPEKLEEAIAVAAEGVEFGRVASMSYLTTETETLERLLAAARVTLATLPRYKEVEVWRITWSFINAQGNWEATGRQEGKERVDAYLQDLERIGQARCIEVTGPHKQLVPK